MDFQDLSVHINTYLNSQFDHATIIDQQNNPFIQVTLIDIKEINPQVYNFSQYVHKPNELAIHKDYTTLNLAVANEVTAEYITQDPDEMNPVDVPYAYCDGIVIRDSDALIVTVVTNQDDAKWVCKSILSQLKIFLNQK